MHSPRRLHRGSGFDRRQRLVHLPEIRFEGQNRGCDRSRPGAVISSFVSYDVEKKVSKTPEKFGTGMIQGVAGPEAALRRSLLLSAGSPLIFVTRPISGVLMLISFLLLAYPLVPWLRRKRAILPQVSDGD